MAEYIERGSLMEAFRTFMAERFDKEKCVSAENCKDCERKCVWHRVVAKAPAADVVEVVRCEKCRFGRNPLPDHGIRQCAKTLMFHPADWYCPNGDRMVSKDVSHLSPEAQGLYHALMNRMDGED